MPHAGRGGGGGAIAAFRYLDGGYLQRAGESLETTLGCGRYCAGGGLCPSAGGDGIKGTGGSLLRRAGRRLLLRGKNGDRDPKDAAQRVSGRVMTGHGSVAVMS